MKAIRYHETGPAEVMRLEEVDRPTPGDGQVLIKVAAVGVNFADVGRRAGTFPLIGQSMPMIPGGECAGTVEALGSGVTAFRTGDRVMARANNCYAEYAVAAASSTYPLPAGLGFTEAASVLTNFTTAWSCVIGRGKVQRGETVLVQAAASGVAVVCVMLAKHTGATVIGTASSDDKLAWAKDYGLDHGINYVRDDFLDEAMKLTGGAGVDVVIDGVGGEVFLKGLKALKRGGRMVVYGVAGGKRTAEVTLPDLWFQNLTVMGAGAGTTTSDDVAEITRMIEKGELKVPVDRVWPLTGAAEAHRYLEERRVRGKVVLTVP